MTYHCYAARRESDWQAWKAAGWAGWVCGVLRGDLLYPNDERVLLTTTATCAKG